MPFGATLSSTGCIAPSGNPPNCAHQPFPYSAQLSSFSRFEIQIDTV
ncbi:hypothetical protein O77CONTIG1_02759 [Leptolyngbya sp. O-77]|nr:hypothetical protein O77CONTIG1_02759 [Leptolyngbya sp. O-77]